MAVKNIDGKQRDGWCGKSTNNRDRRMWNERHDSVVSIQCDSCEGLGEFHCCGDVASSAVGRSMNDGSCHAERTHFYTRCPTCPPCPEHGTLPEPEPAASGAQVSCRYCSAMVPDTSGIPECDECAGAELLPPPRLKIPMPPVKPPKPADAYPGEALEWEKGQCVRCVDDARPGGCMRFCAGCWALHRAGGWAWDVPSGQRAADGKTTAGRPLYRIPCKQAELDELGITTTLGETDVGYENPDGTHRHTVLGLAPAHERAIAAAREAKDAAATADLIANPTPDVPPCADCGGDAREGWYSPSRQLAGGRCDGFADGNCDKPVCGGCWSKNHRDGKCKPSEAKPEAKPLECACGDSSLTDICHTAEACSPVTFAGWHPMIASLSRATELLNEWGKTVSQPTAREGEEEEMARATKGAKQGCEMESSDASDKLYIEARERIADMRQANRVLKLNRKAEKLERRGTGGGFLPSPRQAVRRYATYGPAFFGTVWLAMGGWRELVELVRSMTDGGYF